MEGWEVPRMANDTRLVSHIWYSSNGRQFIEVGENGVTEIIIYQEGGDMGLINYAAIYKGDFLAARIDLRGWNVVYEEPTHEA